MLLLVLTPYPCLSKVLVCGRGVGFFCPLRLFPVFDRLASFDRPRFLRFLKNVMKKVITQNFNTVLSSFIHCSNLSLTTFCHFQAPHVITLRY